MKTGLITRIYNRFTNFKLLFLLCGLLILPMILAACGSAATVPISAITYTGETYNLDSNTNRPVVLNFWFPSCPPCREELPHFEEVYQQYKDRVDFVGVQQLGLESEEDGKAFISQVGVNFPMIADNNATIQLDYNVLSYPSTIFITSNFTVQRTWVGAITKQQLIEQVEQLLSS